MRPEKLAQDFDPWEGSGYTHQGHQDCAGEKGHSLDRPGCGGKEGIHWQDSYWDSDIIERQVFTMLSTKPRKATIIMRISKVRRAAKVAGPSEGETVKSDGAPICKID